MTRGRILRRLFTVLVVTALSVGAVAESADAGLYRRPRNSYGPWFYDVRVCRDGIEFVLASVTHDPLGSLEDLNGDREGVRIVRADGAVVVEIAPSLLPEVPAPYSIFPGVLPALPTKVFGVRVTRPWMVAGQRVRLRAGEQLSASVGLPVTEYTIGINSDEWTDPDPPLVVQRCKVFKPAKADVDIRPGVKPNIIDPASSAPVPIAFFGGPPFDPRLLDVSTVRVGGAPPIAGVGGDADGDGDFDVVLTFSPAASGAACGARRVEVTATSIYGWPIRAREPIRTTC